MKEIQVTIGGQPNQYTIPEAKAMGVNRWKGWTCNVGVDSLYIDFDGQVWRGPCRVGGPLGHMISNWDQSPPDVIDCTRETCDCGTGIKLHKNSAEGHVMPLQEQRMQIQWDLGRRCNLDCSYCWPSSHNKTDEWLSFAVLKVVVDKVLGLTPEPVQFNFAGGEPTLHPEFVDLVTYITELDHAVHVQTNGTFRKVDAIALSAMAQISISVHFEVPSILPKVLRNIETLVTLEAPPEVKMMVPPGGFFAVSTFEAQLRAIPNISTIKLIASPLRDPVTNELMKYTEQELSWFGDREL